MSLARARALAIVGALVAAALILVIAAIVKDRQSTASYAEGGCAPGRVKISTKLPPPSKRPNLSGLVPRWGAMIPVLARAAKSTNIAAERVESKS